MEIYLDDVVVHAATKSQHDQRLAAVREKFRKHSVSINESKSRYCTQSVHFLGYIIKDNTLHLDPDRIQPLLDCRVPKTAKGVQSFLGAVGYYSKFLPHFAKRVEPLRSSLRSEKFAWSAELERAVAEVKQAIAEAPSLALFDPDCETIVTTDGSDVGCGAVLSQRRSGEERVIAYAARVLAPAERNYSAVEREALSCVWAVERWHTYLWGRKFLLRTDSQALAIWPDRLPQSRPAHRKVGRSAQGLPFCHRTHRWEG